MISIIRSLSSAAFILGISSQAHAASGYDQGSPAGAGGVDIDVTINPGNMFDYGQTYAMLGIGLTDAIDVHGYFSHEADGTEQWYAGLMYCFYQNPRMDLSTAWGFRFRKSTVDMVGPQLLYTVKLPHRFDLVGSTTFIYNLTDHYVQGMSLDIGLSIPIPSNWIPTAFEDFKITFGAFKGVAGVWYPTYSMDMSF